MKFEDGSEVQFRDGSTVDDKTMDVIARSFGFGTWQRMEETLTDADNTRKKYGCTWPELSIRWRGRI